MANKVEHLTENPIITRDNLFVIWQESRNVKGITAFIRYVLYYDRYKRLANFGATVISQYQIPYGTPTKLYEKPKE